MSDALVHEIATLRAEVREVREMLRALRELIESRLASQVPVEHPDDLVDADWIAKLFHCQRRSALEGKAGTKGIVFVKQRPKMARRGQVMGVYDKFVQKESPTQRALKLLNRPRRGRRQAK